MQRNLGANAGLDYRELENFISAILVREESVLAALLQPAPAKLDTAGSGEASWLTSLLNLAFDGSGYRGNGQSLQTCGGCKWQGGRIAALQLGVGGSLATLRIYRQTVWWRWRMRSWTNRTVQLCCNACTT